MRRPHPLSLILIVLWLSSMAIVVHTPLKLASLFLLSVLSALVFSGAEPVPMLRGLLKLLPLLGVVFLIQVLAVRTGSELLSIGIASVTDQGLERGLAIALRLATIYMAAKVLAKMNYVEFDDAFRKLGFPDEVGFMVAHAAHLIPGITQTLKARRSILAARGISVRKLPMRDKVLVYKIIALDIAGNLLRGVDTRAMALELRGFRSAGKSSRLRVQALGAMDAVCVLFLIALSQTLYVL